MMKYIRQLGPKFCIIWLLLLSLAACGKQEPLLPKAQTEAEFHELLSQQLAEYSEYFKTFANEMELFYDTVENGESLEDQESYRTLQNSLQMWCEGLETYDQEGVFEAYRPMYEKMMELAHVTRTFLNEMRQIQSTSDMEAVVDTFVQDSSQILAELAENVRETGEDTADPDWIIGQWSVKENGDVYEYRADGTVIFPDGSQHVWRRKGADDVEDTSLWKAVCDETDAQIYYIASDGRDAWKEVVTKDEEGTLHVVRSAVYSDETSTYEYVPVSF